MKFHSASRDTILDTILEVFQKLCPGFLGAAISSEEKALGTRLVSSLWHEVEARSEYQQKPNRFLLSRDWFDAVASVWQIATPRRCLALTLNTGDTVGLFRWTALDK